MELKSRWIKSINDFLVVIFMAALGVFLCVSDKVVEGNLTNLHAGGILVRADMYIRLIGGILILLAVLLFIKNLNFNKSVETEGFKFNTSVQSLLTIVSLIIYTLFLHRIGFAIDTFLLSFFLVFMYMKKENKDVAMTRPVLVRMLIMTCVFSLLLVIVVYVIFGKLLYVSLP